MPSTINPIRVAIAGVGNCASSLIQGLGYYGSQADGFCYGLMQERIGAYGPGDITVVAAFDIDIRKVGRPLSEAILAPPNCTNLFWKGDVPGGDVVVQKGVEADGIAAHMAEYPPEQAFRLSNEPSRDPAEILKEAKADVLVNYMPVGADQATQIYAQACLDAGCAMVNCTPSFIASDPVWAGRFSKAKVVIIGDDIKSQLGATIIHRTLVRLFGDRGIDMKRTYQLNTGGNTDFLNMLARSRLKSKKISKTQSVTSQLSTPLDDGQVHIGPSDYVPWQKDNKVCFIRIEGEGFGGQPMEMELRLSVQDSPNSAGIVIDAIRYAAVVSERNMVSPLRGINAWLMKSPPEQMRDHEAMQTVERFLRDGG